MSPETLDLARWQFALTAGGHFLFVALTLGLATFLALMQTIATVTKSDTFTRMTRFWGRLYVINYAMGIVTGLVMEFQFGLSWSGLTHYAGNVFGASLALETIVAFFVESTFLGLWIFGWDKVNRWVHLGFIWVVTLTAYASAFWILVTNGFLQNPLGYAMDGDKIKLTDFGAVVGNPAAIMAFFHILGGALVVGGFFVAGVSAYHLFKRTPEHRLFTRSLRLGIGMVVPALMFTVTFGGLQLSALHGYQPMKAAAFSGSDSTLAELQADAVARFGPGDYIPPVGAVKTAGIVMMVLFMPLLMFGGLSLLLSFFRPLVHRFRAWHVLLMMAVPWPFLAMISGWVFREMGRQPWVINGLLKTSEAVSDVSPGHMRFSLIAFGSLFAALIVLNIVLLTRAAKRGPVDDAVVTV
ncbi:cytochrome ubiquinol oxidase subunit I [Actinorhabdospora filicis]|uniref:Cytochrome ubiquinol oxidase subunit I n=1 Tax=Actinorhabdospora filicis TaxID=1785913 RepID=A0A9W6SR08_9ACTN|nr:cytochrome ubiquinol oxidase subunit I [Actinorhabdospora filicis]GLZ80409.1 cytochrome ubiquinol oxidase subunit I [Actinorhabdospora filicis]